MDSFPFPETGPPPTIDDATAAIAAQQGMVDDVLGVLAGQVGAALGTQAGVVGSVQKKLTGAVNAALQVQDELVGAVMTALQVSAQALLQEQQAQVNAVVGALLPALPAAIAHNVTQAVQPTHVPFAPGAPVGGLPGSIIPPIPPAHPFASPGASSIGGPEPSSPFPRQTRLPGTSTGSPSMPVANSGASGQLQQDSAGSSLSAPTDDSSPNSYGVRNPAPSGGSANPPSNPPTGPTSGLQAGIPLFPSAPGQEPFQGLIGSQSPGSAPSQLPSVPGAPPTPPAAPTPAPAPRSLVVPPGAPAPVVINPGGPCPPTTVVVNVPPCPPAAPVAAPAAGPTFPIKASPPRDIDVEAAGAEKSDTAKAVCAALDKVILAWTVPGSHEWCIGMPILRDMLTSLGEKLIDWSCLALKGIWTAVNEIWVILNDTVGAVPEFLKPVFIVLRDTVFEGMKAILTARQICDCVKAIAALKGACAPGTMLGLAAVRALMALIRSGQIGVQFPIRLSTTIGLALPQVDRVLEYVTEYACPSIIPEPADAIACYLKGQINYVTFSCWMLCYGCDPEVWTPVAITRGNHLNEHQVIELGRRVGLPDGAILTALQAHGWVRTEDTLGAMTLYDKLPTLGEITTWSRTGALNEGAAARFGLDAGFPILWESDFGRALRAQGVTRATASYSWRAHWRMPGLSEAQQMLWRLRPGRAGVTKAFTDEDFRALIASGDLAPALKDVAYELRFRELQPPVVAQMVARGVLGQARIRDSFLSAGYSAQDAENLTRLESDRTQQALDGSLYGYSPGTIARLVRLGIMTQANANFWFGRWGFNSAQATQATEASINEYEAALRQRYNNLAQRRVLSNTLKAYQVGIVSKQVATTALTRVGMQAATANVLIQATDAAFLTTLASQAITKTKTAFLKAQINREQALVALHTAGIVEPRATQYVTSWVAELRTPEKLLTAAEVVRLFSEGLLTRKTALQRLHTLGYTDPDAQLKIQEAALKLLARRIKAEQSVAKGTKSGLGQLAALASDAAAQAKELFAQSKEDQPVKALRKWLEAGAITPEYAMEVLTDYGYSATAAERTVTEWIGGGIATAAQEAQGNKPTGTVHTAGHG